MEFRCDGCGKKIEYTEIISSSVDFGIYQNYGEMVGVSDGIICGEYCQQCHDDNFDLVEAWL